MFICIVSEIKMPSQGLNNFVGRTMLSTVCRRFVRKTYCQGDILSWIFVRRFVRKTFCQHVFCETFCQEDILSVQFFCGRILHRRFVRKTNCQHFDHISGMLTLFMVCLRYIWYFDHISGMFTLCLVFWPYFWYVDIISGMFTIISGMLTIFLVCLPYVWYFDHISCIHSKSEDSGIKNPAKKI